MLWWIKSDGSVLRRIPPQLAEVRVWGMRTGITVDVKAADRARLEAIVADRNSPQNVWRARIVLLTGDVLGTNEIMRQTGKSKTCLWRWQERFMHDGVDGLLHDKTRPSRVPALGPAIGEPVVALT
jgi:leucine-zipper of insertion element IS481